MATREASSAKLDVEGYTSCRNALSLTNRPGNSITWHVPLAL